MNHTNVIYTIIKKQDKCSPFPYPPLYLEEDTDYICFTNRPDMKSDFWEIKYMEQIEESFVEEFLKQHGGYHHTLYVAPNQILLESKENPNFLITVPDIYEIMRAVPDFENFVPTSNPDGTYHIEPNPEYQDGPYDGRPLLLTIGVPVSNQIETIRRCLNGIQPILEAIPSELLVIDTGSTDGTIEVAKEYQARIVNFPWCNNMSAARNCGIRNAMGGWYMSIDDDEWFESVEDTIDFFQSGKYKNYLFASYIQRNYHSLSLTDHDDSSIPRMAKITPTLHFEGRIHDALMGVQKEHLCYLKDIAHHTGFHRDDKDAFLAKVNRNLSSLYFDLYEYPKDLRYIYQIANEFNAIFQAKYAIAYLYRGLSVNREVNHTYWQKKLTSNLLISLFTDKNPALFSYVQTCLSDSSYTISEMALIHYMLFQLASELEYEIPFIEKEASEYEYYRNQFLSNVDYERQQMMQYAILDIDVCENSSYISAYRIARFALAVRKQEEMEAEDWLKQIDLTQAKQGDVLIFCSNIIHCKTSTLVSYGLQKIENYIGSLSQEQIAFFADLVWKKHISASQDSLGFVFFQHYITASGYTDLSVSMQYWLAILGEKLFLAMQDKEDDAYLTIFLNYIEALFNYAIHYYNPVLFSEDSSFLPENIRAGYHIVQALEAAEKKNPLCIKELKSALHIFPNFKRGISLLFEQLKSFTL